MTKLIKHPLIEIKLTKMRDENSSHIVFKKNLNEIGSLMVYEILRNYKPKVKKIKTPTNSITNGKTFNNDIVIVPILRAGLGMVAGIETLIPQAKIGHIGIFRNNKTFQVEEYFYKIPIVSKKAEIIVVDPMLATGVTAINAINKIKKDGYKNIRFVCLVAAPEGLLKLEKKHPDIDIYIVAIDKKLNDKKYIIPGLGDSGDRIFGTK
jgi:uracil phosphoribosyltransferase